MSKLETADEGAIVFLHACSHNPTGFDLNIGQWKELLTLTQKKKFIPYFDMAYQGFASGNPDRDGEAVRLFADAGVPLCLGTSFAKNMGLYGTRTGTFSIVCDSPKEAQAVQSQLDCIARNTYSSPALHGSKFAEIILGDKELKAEWYEDLLTMSGRIRSMREQFVAGLYKAGSPHNWDHILQQIGMFAFTGIGPNKCKELVDDHHVYLTMNGRISVAGLNPNNLDYVINAVHQVTKDGRN